MRPLSYWAYAGLSDRQPLEDTLVKYESARNARKAGYYGRNWKASQMVGWDDPAVLQLRTALRNDPDEADRWAGTIAFPVDYDEFYSSSFVEESTTNAA